MTDLTRAERLQLASILVGLAGLALTLYRLR